MAVERKMLGCEPGQAESGARIGKCSGKRVVGKFGFTGRLNRGDEVAFAPAQRGFHRVGQTLARARFEHEAIDHGLDDVAALFIEANLALGSEVRDVTINARADETLATQFFDDVAELAGLSAHDRGQQDQFAVRRQSKDGIGDFLRRLPAHDFAGLRIVRNAERRVENAQVVVDLSRGGDGGTRSGGRGALLDGDGRREAFDKVHIGALEAIEELTRISREAFDIFALAFGIERIESEG